MKIERLISCFDRETEELVCEYNIDHIELETIKEIVQRKRDPFMYRPQTLKKNDLFTIEKISAFDLSSNLIDVFISVDEKGYWVSISGKEYIKHDCIRVDWGSASLSFSYYWKNNVFHKFISD